MSEMIFPEYSRYSKKDTGQDWEECCRIPAHETLLTFNNDTDSEAFEAWFKSEGFALFVEFEKTYKPTYGKQTQVVRQIIKDCSN